MERIINLQVERLPEGLWLATSEEVEGLTVQAENLSDLVAWSREIARDLLALKAELSGAASAPVLADRLSLPVVVAA